MSIRNSMSSNSRSTVERNGDSGPIFSRIRCAPPACAQDAAQRCDPFGIGMPHASRTQRAADFLRVVRAAGGLEQLGGAAIEAAQPFPRRRDTQYLHEPETSLANLAVGGGLGLDTVAHCGLVERSGQFDPQLAA